MMNAATRPMMSLRPWVGGAFSASPVNSTCDAGRRADVPQLVLEIDDCPSAAARTRSDRTARRSTRSGRPWPAGARPGASGLVMALTSLAGVQRGLGLRCRRPASAAIAAWACGESRLWPWGAATTTRSADPFWPPNLALIRSVAFWTSDPGMLKSLTSVPWNATFSPISETKMTSQVPTTRHGCRAQCPAQRASAPVWAIRFSSSIPVPFADSSVIRPPPSTSVSGRTVAEVPGRAFSKSAQSFRRVDLPAAGRFRPARPGSRGSARRSAGRRRPGPSGTRSPRAATSTPASSIARRSSPNAMPPCGGAPIASARSRNENFSSASLGRDAEQLEHALLHLRAVDADRAAADLVAVQDEVVLARPGRRRDPSQNSLRAPAPGAVNGLCAAFQRFSSGSHSNIGKPVTQRKLPARRRSGPAARPGAGAAAPARARPPPPRRPPGRWCRPRPRRSARRSLPARPATRNFAIGERISPPACTCSQATPLPPHPLANSTRSSKSLRENSMRAGDGEAAHDAAARRPRPGRP